MLTTPISSSEQQERAIEMKHHVRGYDAIIISEAFYNSVREDYLIPGLSIDYPYYTSVVDQSGSIEDGGVMIFSRYPIETEAQFNFSDCDGSDCFSAKGVMYARINKMGKRYHLFGSHTQAWPEQTPVEIRQTQLAEIRNFIASEIYLQMNLFWLVEIRM